MLTRNRRSGKRSPHSSWKLQDAKSRFSEVVRLARSEGPQRVTVHGKDAVVVVAADDFDKTAAPSQAGVTGAAFAEAMQRARKLGLRLKPIRYYPIYRVPIKFESDGR